MNSAKHFKYTENSEGAASFIIVVCIPLIVMGATVQPVMLPISLTCIIVPILIWIYIRYMIIPKCNKRGCAGTMNRKTKIVKFMRHYKCTGQV